MNKKAIYIYCFIPDSCFLNIEDNLKKLGIYQIGYNNIHALVSDTEYDKIEHLDRESLAHLLVEHQQTIERLMSCGCASIIPMKLGTIVGSCNDVIAIIKNGFDILSEAFKVIDQVEEVDLVAVWNNFPDLITRISNTPEVSFLKQTIINKNSYVQADSINIGKLIKEKIDQENHKVNEEIFHSVMPFCLDVKKHETMNDQMPLNYAFLIKKENHHLFVEMIDKLDIQYADNLNFKVVGPLPCYSFYTIESKALNKNDIENAKRILGLDSIESDLELKKAYRTKAALNHPDKQNDDYDGGVESFIEINNAYKLLLDYSALINKYPENILNEVLYMVKIIN